MTMIKNVIFDFGQVLVRFDPIYMCERYASGKDEIQLLSNVIFDRLYWDRLDAGTITDDEVIESVCKRIPEHLHAKARDIYFNWIYNIPEIEGMRDVIALCKNRGYGVYLLSNISTYFADHREEIPILKLLDGCVFSAVLGKVKPSAEIFGHICTEFNLKPEETLFIDDSPKNVAGAKAFGISTYLFEPFLYILVMPGLKV